MAFPLFRWLKFSLVNLLIVASIGLVLRYKRLVLRYSPPDRVDLKKENAKLKAEIDKLKGEEESKKRKTK